MALEDAAKIEPRKRFIELVRPRFWEPELLRAHLSGVLEVSQAEDIRQVDTTVGGRNKIKR